MTSNFDMIDGLSEIRDKARSMRRNPDFYGDEEIERMIGILERALTALGMEVPDRELTLDEALERLGRSDKEWEKFWSVKSIPMMRRPNYPPAVVEEPPEEPPEEP